MEGRRWLAGVLGWLVLPISAGYAQEEPPSSDAVLSRAEAVQQVIDSALQRMTFTGQVRQELAYRIDESREWTKFRTQALLGASGSLTDELSFRATGRMYYDPVYDLTDNFPHTTRNSQRFEAELRDTYLDYSSGPIDLRIGKQQIVWGEAVGLFFADVVNAKDLREFVLPDFDLIRIPQWAIDLEYTQGEGHVELVWLPVREFHRLGVKGAEFHLDPVVPAGTAFTETDPSKPPRSFSDSEAGVRLGYLLSGWDLGAFYLYTWDKFPVPYRTISGGTYNFLPQYRRAHILGTSFSKDLNDVVLKGELTVNPGADLQTLDANDTDGIVERPVVDYLIGADYTFFGKVDTNVQLMQRVIGNHPDGLVEDEVRTHVSFWAKTDLLDGKIEPEFLVIAGLHEPDTMYRPKVTFKLTDALQWRVGADIFQGRPLGVFGRFDNKSRLYTELTYYF